MNILLRVLIALLLGAIAAFVAGLLLNDFWSTVVGIVVGLMYFLGGDDLLSRR